ncbi:MAG: hypothetical protein HY906_21940 [Deltaproteobacteria bacterium]|nr:hypothetical protein [Deltaproteobacteria bacterium]
MVKVEWAADHVEVTLAGTREPPSLTLIITATRRGQPAFLVGPEVSLWVQGAEVPEQLAARLRAVTERALPRLALADLERMVALDPELTEIGTAAAVASPLAPALSDDPAAAHREPTARAGPALEGISIPTAGQHALTAPEFYADFLAAPELRRAGCDIIDVHSAHTLVSHGDVECAYCAVCVPRPRCGLLRLPVYETVRNIGRLPHGQGRFDESEDLADVFCSDMTEQDVISGAPGMIRQVLRQADTNRKKDRLLVIGLCLPDVIGADQEAAVQDYRAATDTAVYMVPSAPRSWSWFAADLLRSRRKALDHTGPPDPRAVNLIGYPENAGTRELSSLLADLGVAVNTCVLPELSMSSVERIPRAALNVFLPNVHWEKVYEHLRGDGGRTHLEIDGPYGIAGTRAWLQSVSAALGMGRDLDELLRRRLAPLQERWDRLRQEARGFRLGFVVPAEDSPALLQSRFTWGIPLAAAIHEMGFGLDLFVGGPASPAAAAQIRAGLGLAPADYELHEFDSLPGMLDALAQSQCQAVFSNYVFDWRLVRTGKAPFSTLEFEMGVAGAVATLKRLVAVCRLPLFRGGRRFMNDCAPRGLELGR